MDQPTTARESDDRRRLPRSTTLLFIGAVYVCAIYANLSFVVRNSADYRFFPPFQRHVNANHNHHLGGESFNMARALVAGKGFASPFDYPSGPTAWHPPVLPLVLAALLNLVGGARDAVMAVVVFLQVLILIGTGLLVMILVRRTNRWAASTAAAVLFLAWLLCHFHLCFQTTQDYWLILLSVDVVIIGLCWWRPLRNFQTAAGWGVFGGLCALLNPVVGLTWGVLSVITGCRRRAGRQLAAALLAFALTLVPWTIRNYLVFGRLIPVKSNLMYELYQSQCMQADGLAQEATFQRHPYSPTTAEAKEYQLLGETAYLDRKGELFWQAVRADPLDFVGRVVHRFLGATLWYVPFDREAEASRPWSLGISRLVHPLPFLALVVLLVKPGRRLLWAQRIVIGVYVCYLLPYVVISYYDRYAVPLYGAKVLLILWAADRLLAKRTAASAAHPGPAMPAEDEMT
jgi:hypothetical protein